MTTSASASTTPAAARPLAGVRVLDFGRVIAAPRAARFLADLGADVVHVESIDGGDHTRADPHDFGNGLSGAFVQENWGKRSLAIDLKHERAHEVIEPLVRHADIVLENFRPGVMARLGLGYDRLAAINPRIIMCSISGFGQASAADSAGAYGFLADAIAGFPQLTGDADGPPVPSPIPIADVMSSALVLGLVCAALHARNVTGQGQHIDFALLDAALAAHDMALQTHLSSAGALRPSRRGANDPVRVPSGYFEGRDGWLCVICGTDRHWQSLLALMGERGADLQAFRDARQRQQAAQLIYSRIEAWVQDFDSVGQVADLLERGGVPAARLNTIEEVANDPRVMARQLIQTVEQPGVGALRVQNFLGPNGDATALRPAPLLGEHSREIATEVGVDGAQLDALIAAGCIGVRS